MVEEKTLMTIKFRVECSDCGLQENHTLKFELKELEE